jgi:L-ascorbate metabolism protein UlaG (beta-lactamase superfamily)
MELTCHHGTTRDLLRAPLPDGSIALGWLGQAGFVFRSASLCLLVDPYLSDHLAEKYRGRAFPHERLTPAPLQTGDLNRLDYVFCSHRHSDHMDPVALPALAAVNPGCRFVLPRAECDYAAGLGLPADRILGVNAGDQLPLDGGFSAHVVASAHEQFKTDSRGNHYFLGFVIRSPAGTFYHSGDSVVYQGLAESVASFRVGLALLPVNGRDPDRTGRGVPGNMTFTEARQLCAAAGIPAFVPHHFGMFAFNTVPLAELRLQAAQPGPRAFIPSTNEFWIVTRTQNGIAHE